MTTPVDAAHSAKYRQRPAAVRHRWSSDHLTAGGDPQEWFDLRAALFAFDDDPVVAHANYRAFVDGKIVTGDSLWKKLVAGIYLVATPG